MKQQTYICILIVVAGVLLASTIAAPALLSDQNTFLKEFVGADFLSVLGVILAITLASAAQLHLAFNKIEARFRSKGFVRSRASVRHETYALIWLFLVAIVIVIGKAELAKTPWAQSAFNCAALYVLLWNVLLLLSLTRTVFALPPVFDEHEEAADAGKRNGRKHD